MRLLFDTEVRGALEGIKISALQHLFLEKIPFYEPNLVSEVAETIPGPVRTLWSHLFLFLRVFKAEKAIIRSLRSFPSIFCILISQKTIKIRLEI